MNINNPDRPLCTQDPGFDSFLPVDDEAFDQDVSLSSLETFDSISAQC